MATERTTEPAPEQPETRVAALLSAMSLEDKIGQMMQLDGRRAPLENLEKYRPGSFLHMLDDEARDVQQAALNMPLGIPLLFGIDAIHGHSFHPGASMFPTQLGVACTWNPDAARTVGRVTAAEMRPTGVHWTFAPVLCITRDLRWGRVGETFGEDPYLIECMATAMIDGLQGDDPLADGSILACAKHFAGYSETLGGRDASEADLSWRKLNSFFLPPFEAAARSGCASFMTGYQSIDGAPCTSSRTLLTETLRDKWGFAGIVVTDWRNVAYLVGNQQVFETMAQAAAAAVHAGNDLIMATPEFFDAAREAVEQQLLEEADIDKAVRRILALKVRMGLFENPRLPQPERLSAVVGCAPHREALLSCARESVVLLENRNQTLPLQRSALRTVAVVGPHADDAVAQLGDWSLGSGQAGHGTHPRECTATVLDGIRTLSGDTIEVRHARGADAVASDDSGIEEAVSVASQTDVIVAVVGDHLKHIGEGKSTATLELQGSQQRLLEALKETGKPLIVVLIASKPLAVPWIAAHADAFVLAFNPGMAGGTAVAEVLFGETNPSGRLPVGIPRHVGQQPVYYNQVRGEHGWHYADCPREPLYAFGQGLSYTRFAYDALTVETPTLAKGDALKVAVEVTNAGERAGVETVQLYIHDKVTSLTWPIQELKAFQRVALEPGQTERVELSVPYRALAIVDNAGERVVEPGGFEVRVGGSSRGDGQLTAEFSVAS